MMTTQKRRPEPEPEPPPQLEPLPAPDEPDQTIPYRVVRYPGDQVTRARELYPRDFQGLGVEDLPDDKHLWRWGPENNWEITADNFDFLTKEQFDAMFNARNGFEVLEK